MRLEIITPSGVPVPVEDDPNDEYIKGLPSRGYKVIIKEP